MNDNEESINMTIEEDEQKLIHAQVVFWLSDHRAIPNDFNFVKQAQDGKDEKDESKSKYKVSVNTHLFKFRASVSTRVGYIY